MFSVFQIFRHGVPSTTTPIPLSSLPTTVTILIYNTAQLSSWGELCDVPPRSPFKEAIVAPALGVLLYQPLAGNPSETASPEKNLLAQVHACYYS